MSNENKQPDERAALIDRLCGQLSAAVHFMPKGSDFDCKEALALIEEARATSPQATKGDEAAATLIAIGRLFSEAGYAPELRVIDAVREVISRAAVPQAEQRMSDAERDVLAERARQVSEEGWTPEHDEQHDCGQIAGAASCYAAHVNGRQWVFFEGRHDDYMAEHAPSYWPWVAAWWKPTTPRRDLVKAGALILAEIERIDRAEVKA